MTKLLEKALDAIRRLPEEEQDEIARMPDNCPERGPTGCQAEVAHGSGVPNREGRDGLGGAAK